MDERVGYMNHSFRISVRPLKSYEDKTLEESEGVYKMSNLLVISIVDRVKIGAFGECWCWEVDNVADVIALVIIIQQPNCRARCCPR